MAYNNIDGRISNYKPLFYDAEHPNGDRLG